MSVTIAGYEDVVTKTTFPGGESCIRLDQSFQFLEDTITLMLAFESNNDLFDLALLADAVRRQWPSVTLRLLMPYVPYARQDRVCNEGESLSVKVVADFINALEFEYVAIVDPHSDVTPALLNNVVVYPQDCAVGKVARVVDVSNTVIVAPDAGAAKKARKFAQKGNFAGLVQAEKVRELSTGKILETRISMEGHDHNSDHDFLIVDDICDGGRTFTELAKVLRPYTDGKIMLYVTHGIFSAGPEVFDNLIDVVYTANTVGQKAKDAVNSGKVIKL